LEIQNPTILKLEKSLLNILSRHLATNFVLKLERKKFGAPDRGISCQEFCMGANASKFYCFLPDF